MKPTTGAGSPPTLLIQPIHACAVKFSEVVASVVHAALVDFFGDPNNPSALDFAAFVRNVVEKFSALRKSIVSYLISTLPEIRSSRVRRGVGSSESIPAMFLIS
jgi:coatomer subunit beta